MAAKARSAQVGRAFFMSFDRPSRGGLDSEPATSRGRRQARRRAGADSNQPEWVVIQTFTRVGLTQEAQQIQISPENRACEACAFCIPGAHCERKALRPAGCSWQRLCSGIRCKRRWASCVSPTYTGSVCAVRALCSLIDEIATKMWIADALWMTVTDEVLGLKCPLHDEAGTMTYA